MGEEVSVVCGWSFKLFVFFCLGLTALFQEKLYSKEDKDIVEDYLLPEDHPIKPFLDSVFTSFRATFNLSTLKKAGFKKAKPRKYTKLIVTKHRGLPGYVFKLYLDAQRYHKDLPEHHMWVLRIQGAEKIRKEIVNRGYEKWFKVPRKWIYALPKHPSPPIGYYTKRYILIEEDMEIFPNDENKTMWSSDYVTQEFLDALFVILKNVGLNDCVKPDNIPFSIDGRAAFIDTQSHGEKVSYKNLCPYLSDSNRAYWKTITNGSDGK